MHPSNLIELTALLHVMPMAHMVLDADSAVIAVSRGIWNISGYGEMEIIGSPLTVLIPDDVRHPHFKSLAVYASNGYPVHMQALSNVPLKRKDGTIVRVSVERYAYRFAGALRFGGIIRLLDPKAAYAPSGQKTELT